MQVDFGLVSNFFIALLAILNPIGNVPIFLEHVNQESAEVQKNLAKLMAMSIFTLLIFFYFTGQPFLRIFSISIPAFRIAGGILILMIGLRMLNGKPKFDNEGLEAKKASDNPFMEATNKLGSILVPVAFPIFVGPGAITTVILYAQRTSSIMTGVAMIFAAAGVCTLIGVVLYMSRHVFKALGKNGMQIVSRAMGLILCAIAVQFMIDGVSQLIPGILNPIYTHVKN